LAPYQGAARTNMRKLIHFSEMTVDGYFEGKKAWDLSFLQETVDREIGPYTDQMNRDTGVLLLGRKTYEGNAAYFPTQTDAFAQVLNAVPKVVFSRTLPRADWNNTTLERGSPEEVVRKLKRKRGKDLYIVGSAQLASRLRKHDLIDEFRIWLNPAILGRGRPLFPADSKGTPLTLLEARPVKSGCVLLRYQLRMPKRRRKR
jgi:dihydrofolate reductase